MVKDSYGQALVTQKTSIFDLKSVFGLCGLRDKVTVVGTGSVSTPNDKFVLSVTDAADVSTLASRERGVYVSGLSCEVGIGLQTVEVLTGEQVLRFGYFDDENGYFFMIDASGMSCVIRRSGIDSAVPQAQWNGDWAGSGGVETTAGQVWHINYSYYGYGPVVFSIVYTSERGIPTIRVLHTYGPVSHCSCDNPHLPIQVNLRANTTAAPVSVYVTSRQFSVLGQYDPCHRISSYVHSQGSISSSEWTPGFSLDRKPTRAGAHITVSGYDIVTTAPLLMLFRLGSVLTGADFQDTLVAPDCIDGAGLLMDVDSSTMDQGYIVYTKLLAEGYNTEMLDVHNVRVLIDDRPLSVSFRALQGSADVQSMVLRVKEAH